jgi:fructose-specific phosphotransferase system component IIB
MRPLQIERLFIEMLESVDVEEADTVVLAKDKLLQTKWNISTDIVKAAFPSLNITGSIKAPEKTDEQRVKELYALADKHKEDAKKLTTENL